MHATYASDWCIGDLCIDKKGMCLWFLMLLVMIFIL